jgi:hypothetical protein
VAINRFIDDVSVLAIEDCLIGKVAGLFKSTKITKMSAEQIARLAGETTESSIERNRLTEKRKILEAGLSGFKSLQKQGQHTRPDEWERVVPEDAESKPDLSTLSFETASNANSVTAPSIVDTEAEANMPVGGDFELASAPPIAEWRARTSRTAWEGE